MLASHGDEVWALEQASGRLARISGLSRRVTGAEIPVEEGPRRPGDPAELYASIEKAQAELGWKVQFTEIDAIIASAWRWHQAMPNGYTE